MKKFLLLFFALLPLSLLAQTRVDTLSVFSQSMQKSLQAAITLPSSYDTSKEQFPVLYLLHGGSGAFSDWHKKVTEPGLLNRMAEQH